MKFLVFIFILYGLSAQALGDYFSTKVQGSEYHIFLGPSGSYLYKVGGSQALFLKKEMLLGTVKTFEVFESNHREKPIGYLRIGQNTIETFEVEKVKGKNLKLKKIKMPLEQIVIREQVYNNEKCSFKFVDLNDISDLFLFKEISFLISELMDSFKEYNCDYLQSSRSNEMDPKLNQLICENETVKMKDRFFGITFSCRANMAGAKPSDYKFQAFSIIFDKTLKARVEKRDFTDSDIADEDDYRNFKFRLTPVGLGLYSSNKVEGKVEYVKIMPYIDLKTHFSAWGKPKRYLNNFSVK